MPRQYLDSDLDGAGEGSGPRESYPAGRTTAHSGLRIKPEFFAEGEGSRVLLARMLGTIAPSNPVVNPMPCRVRSLWGPEQGPSVVWRTRRQR